MLHIRVTRSNGVLSQVQRTNPPDNHWLALGVLLILCFSVAGVGGLATAPSIPNWYAGLAKPSWTPPGWIFGPVWSVLYLSMAVAAWLVWRRGDAVEPMTLFGIQLFFNAAWSWLFFGLHSPSAAFMDIVLLWTAMTATMVFFWRRSTLAGFFLSPI